MCALLSGQGLAKAFGAQTLFTGVSLGVDRGDRVGLIGPNGSGKSTLLRILCGLEPADSGTVALQKLARTAYLAQEDVFDDTASCADNLLAAAADLDMDEAERYSRVLAVLSRARFDDPLRPVAELSGGWRKRLAVCRALVGRPDVLVMDEPTNHLDIEGILWLEQLLLAPSADGPAALLMVSHDRRFLENTVNRVIELAPVYPDGSFQVRGSYADFLEKKADFLVQRQNLEERLANRLRRETEWLRRGPKARATKARYRIEEAGRLQEAFTGVRDRNRAAGQVGISFDGTGWKTKKLLTATGLAKGYGGGPLFTDLDLTLGPGTRLGLLGRNGSGKSTLMRILAAAGDPDGCAPDRGTITLADQVRIVSFDQRREQLDTTLTLRRALAPEGDSVLYQGQSVHVVSWAKRFLFRPDQLETPVERLSGGEQARLLMARLMLRPAQLLVLDEPTNDLDLATLNVLEESLAEFPGALLLVSHDRAFLDRATDSLLAFDPEGGCGVTALAGLDQWERWRKERREAGAKAAAREKEPEHAAASAKAARRRLGYLEQRELDGIEPRILDAEERLAARRADCERPEVVSDGPRLVALAREIEEAQAEVDRLYARWAELSG